MKKVIWTQSARRSSHIIINLIALEQPYSAQVLHKAIVHLTLQLSHFPHLGKKLKKKSQPDVEYREYILRPLRIIYRVEAKEVIILQVLRTEEVTRLALMVAEQAANYQVATATG